MLTETLPEPEESMAKIDRSLCFISERLTPLFYTPIYAELTEPQRRLYNQMTALSYNEQLVFFESTLPERLFKPLLSRSIYADLHEDIRNVIREESEHADMFRSLNRKCAPEWYRNSDFYFVDPPKVWQHLWAGLSRQPWLLTGFLWLVMLMEEKAVVFAKILSQDSARLEPNFVETHRRHAADESSHCNCDASLLEFCCSRDHPVMRRFNARFFLWMLREFFTAPKRGGARVLDAWLRVFPEYAPRRRQILDHYRDLQDDPDFLSLHYGPEAIPGTLKLMSRWPEFGAFIDYVQDRSAARSQVT